MRGHAAKNLGNRELLKPLRRRTNLPKRLLDGEALWASRKLRRVREPSRIHYANWVPLAEANGVFEADTELVWSRVYAALMPSFTVEQTQDLIDEFVRVGLVVLWQQDGTTWGYFTGMEKEGRLPSASHLKRYKNLPPDCPSALLSAGQAQDWSCIVRDRVSENLSHTPIQSNPILTNPNQSSEYAVDEGVNNDMLVETDLKARARIYFQGYSGETLTAEQRRALRAKADDLGGPAILALFDSWAKKQATRPARPLAAFLGYRPTKDEIVESGATVGQSEAAQKEIQSLLIDMAKASKGEVVVGKRHLVEISGVLTAYGHEIVLAAFRDWYQGYEGNKNFGDVDFANKAVVYCELVLDRRVQAEQLNETMAAARKELETMPLLAAQTEEGDENAEIEI